MAKKASVPVVLKKDDKLTIEFPQTIRLCWQKMSVNVSQRNHGDDRKFNRNRDRRNSKVDLRREI